MGRTNPANRYESSAAAIAVGGFIQLAKLTVDPTRSLTHRSTTHHILDTLTTPEFLVGDDEQWEGILKHSSYHEKKGPSVDKSVAWGDHFFLEAAGKVQSAELENLLI
ncbi:MAG: hypothetical protein M9918_23565 [Anaerolineae bacterium]|nr:hypothetical protein [Anaerolineae bacterium]MCO5191153.1 hypothetical protein [Anaerolineae bacterium]